MFLEGLFHLQLTWLILILENRHRLGDHGGDTGVMQGAQFEPPCLFQLHAQEKLQKSSSRETQDLRKRGSVSLPSYVYMLYLPAKEL